MGAVEAMRAFASAPVIPAAFETLFRKEYARVVAIAARIVRDRDEAEDVAQDVFVSLLPQAPGGRALRAGLAARGRRAPQTF